MNYKQGEDLLILVDKNDKELGTLGKLSVHEKGLLHRAFSIFIFNSKDELLLQQRADGKYHSEGLWTNTCCSHPRHGEEISSAVHRRLEEEMGMKSDLIFEFSFKYKMKFANGLTEHELDHVYFGRSDDLPQPNKNEVKNWKYITLPKLEEEIRENPQKFSGWLNICLPKVMKHFNQDATL